MEKIRFLDSSTIYDVILTRINGSAMQITFTEGIIPNIVTSGFELLNENNGEIMGNYHGYTTIYRTNEEKAYTIELSNNGAIYVEPEPAPIPEPYVHTPEELEAIFQQNKRNKIAESKDMLASYLEDHPLTSTAHGGISGTYSVTSEKQTLMMSQYMTYQIEKQINPNAVLTWNETGKVCETWEEADFLQLILKVKAYIYPLVSYQQKIEETIMQCTTQEELDTITIDYYSAIPKETNNVTKSSKK